MLDKNINKLTNEIEKLHGELDQITSSRDIMEKKLRDAEYAEYSASEMHDIEEQRKRDELINESNLPEPPEDDNWFINMLNEPDSAPEEYYERSDIPEYIVASISEDAEETYVFEADANGNILSYEEYGGLAYRWGDANWRDIDAAVKLCMSQTYMKVNRVNKGNHTLFRLVDDKEIHQPDEFTHWDGDESDKISY
jgi:hypothetical protein